MTPTKKTSQDDGRQATLVPRNGHGAERVLVEPGLADSEDPNELSEETLLPISGMVRLSRRELEVISHPAFQRLFEIYQLGQTHLVYRGATHMRGEHAIGCVKATMYMVEAVERNRARGQVMPSDRWQKAMELSSVEIAFVRLGALLHDIGHLPAGHTLEDELGLLPSHDGDERIERVLDREEWHGRRYQSLGSLINELYREDVEESGQKKADSGELSATELLLRLISKDHSGADSTAKSKFRVGVCRDIVGNTICADLIDYLHRDWMHIGKPRQFDPRLLDYMHILTRSRDGRREDRLVIHLGKKDRPRPDAVTAILDLLDGRYQLSEIALFHRVKLAATGMLERAIAEYRDSFKGEEAQRNALSELVPELLECSDAEVSKLLERKLLDRRTKSNGPRLDAAIDLVRRLRVRKLHQDFHAVYLSELSPEYAAEIVERFSGDPSGGEDDQAAVRRAAHNRLLAVRALEEEFALPPGSVVMYCPPRNMNSKIAEVGIYSKGHVDSLANFDRDGRITGGYLQAQQERFQRLWRISFALDRDRLQDLEEGDLLDLFRRLIDKTTLWVPGDLDDDAQKGVRDIAETLVHRESSPWFGHDLIEPALNREQASIEHPGGAPSARSFISPKPKGS